MTAGTSNGSPAPALESAMEPQAMNMPQNGMERSLGPICASIDPEKRDKIRYVDLYNYLLIKHSLDVIEDGGRLLARRRMAPGHPNGPVALPLKHGDVSVKRGGTGFKDLENELDGDAERFLMDYLGYSPDGAVEALYEFTRTHPAAAKPWSEKAPEGAAQVFREMHPAFELPEPAQGSERLIGHLVRERGIPEDLIRRLVDWGLLYQEKDHGAMVFANVERTYAELHGTDPHRPLRAVLSGSAQTGFWWFKPRSLHDNPVIAYACETATEAVALYLLLSGDKSNRADDALYCAIGGLSQERIDVIKAGMAAAGCRTVLAVGGDWAGVACRQRNPDCGPAIPRMIDWATDWMDALASRATQP